MENKHGSHRHRHEGGPTTPGTPALRSHLRTSRDAAPPPGPARDSPPPPPPPPPRRRVCLPKHSSIHPFSSVPPRGASRPGKHSPARPSDLCPRAATGCHSIRERAGQMLRARGLGSREGMSPSISARDAVTAGKGLCCLKAGGCASPGGFSEKSERPPRLARPTAIAHEPGEAGDTPRTPRHVSPPPRAVRTTMPRHLPPPQRGRACLPYLFDLQEGGSWDAPPLWGGQGLAGNWKRSCNAVLGTRGLFGYVGKLYIKFKKNLPITSSKFVFSASLSFLLLELL